MVQLYSSDFRHSQDTGSELIAPIDRYTRLEIRSDMSIIKRIIFKLNSKKSAIKNELDSMGGGE